MPNDVSAVRIAPDKSYLVTATDGGVIRRYSFTTEQELPPWETGLTDVRRMEFSPDGKLLAVISYEAEAVLVETSTGGLHRRFPRPMNEKGPPDVDFCDNETLLTTGAGGVVSVWNVNDGKLRMAWDLGDVTIADFVVNSVYGIIALYLEDSPNLDTLKIYDAPGGKPVGQLPMSDAGRAFSLALSPSGQFLAVGLKTPAAIQVWDWRAGQQVARLSLTENAPELQFSNDGQFLAAADQSGVARVWRWVSETTFGKAFTPSPKVTQHESDDQTTHVHWQAHGRPARSVVFCHDSRQLVSAGRDGRVVRWHWDQTGLKMSLHEEMPKMAWVDERRACALFEEDALRLIDRSTGKLLDRIALRVPPRFGQVCESSAGGQLVWSTSAGSVVCWRTNGTKVLDTISALNGMSPVQFVPQSGLLMTHSIGGPLKCWDLDTQVLVFERTSRPGREVRALAPDEPRLYFLRADSLSWIDVTTGVLNGEFAVNGSDANCLAVSPLGRYVAFGQTNRRIEIVNLETRETQITLVGHLGAIKQLQFTSDGKTLFALDARGTLKLWQVSQGAELLTWSSRTPIQAFSLSPDGNGIAVIRGTDLELIEVESAE